MPTSRPCEVGQGSELARQPGGPREGIRGFASPHYCGFAFIGEYAVPPVWESYLSFGLRCAI
jgi:hypothetical protein